MDGHLRPQDVRRHGCGADALREMVAVVPPGTHVRQLVEIDHTSAGSVSASVRVTALKPGSFLASLRGMETVAVGDRSIAARRRNAARSDSMRGATARDRDQPQVGEWSASRRATRAAGRLCAP
jgi:hypothetical protein